MMHNLFTVFNCPKCGKVLEDEVIHGEEIDTENDEVYSLIRCCKCGSDVTPRMNDEGDHVFEEVSEERVYWFRNQFPAGSVEEDEDEINRM